MASIFAHLLETLPLTVAIQDARRTSGIATGDVPFTNLAPNLRALAKTGVHTVAVPAVPPLPAVPTSPTGVVVNTHLYLAPGYSARRLWHFQHDGSSPYRITDVSCRVRETGYKQMSVADTIEVGFEESGALSHTVRVVLENGSILNLPLDAAHLHSRWAVVGGRLGEAAVPKFPLEAHLDHAVVLAFAYDLGSGATFTPYQAVASELGEQALTQLQAGVASVVDAAGDRWLRRAMTGDFMPSAEEAAARASVGASTPVAVSPPRILVMVSFSVFRERADFEPGGIVGMGRCYPHIQIKASIPVRAMHASVKFTRPTASTTRDTGDGTVVGTCCEAYGDIKSILVADANEDLPLIDNAYKGFWSGTFAYVEVDPELRLRHHVLRAVRRDKPTTRTIASCGNRHLPDHIVDIFNLTSIEKRPRQGEFDNIHVAPRLRFRATELQALGFTGRYWAPITSPSAMKLDPVVMAPFCAHDCFHQHWRWSPDSNAVMDAGRWTKGWGVGGDPYTEEAVPLTPPNHDVEVVVHGANVWSYIEHAYPTHEPSSDASGTIAARDTQIFCYAGAAYAQGIITWRHYSAARVDVTMAMTRIDATARLFRNAAGVEMRPSDTPAALYWTLRYYAHEGASGWEAKEFLQISTADIDRARWY